MSTTRLRGKADEMEEDVEKRQDVLSEQPYKPALSPHLHPEDQAL
jgi:hypothetical protein